MKTALNSSCRGITADLNRGGRKVEKCISAVYSLWVSQTSLGLRGGSLLSGATGEEEGGWG